MNASFLALQNAAMLAGVRRPRLTQYQVPRGGTYPPPVPVPTAMPLPPVSLPPMPPVPIDPRSYPVDQRGYPVDPRGYPAPVGCAPCASSGADTASMAALAYELLAQLRGGSMGDGYPACAPHPNPPIPIGADGCPSGEVQCLQPIPVNSAPLIAAGATAIITVNPRSMATPREFIYTGLASAFTIDSVIVDGKDYLNGAILADRYLPIVTNRAVDWGGGFSSNTQMFVTVTNVSATPATFFGTLDCSVNRS